VKTNIYLNNDCRMGAKEV